MRQQPAGVAKPLAITAVVVAFFVSTVMFTRSFTEASAWERVSALAGLFLNAYIPAASIVVLGWFGFRLCIEPRLRYQRLRRMRMEQGRSRNRAR